MHRPLLHLVACAALLSARFAGADDNYSISGTRTPTGTDKVTVRSLEDPVTKLHSPSVFAELPPGALLAPQDRAYIEGLDANPGFGATPYAGTHAFDGSAAPTVGGGSVGTLASGVGVGTIRPSWVKRFWVESLVYSASEPVLMYTTIGGGSNIVQTLVSNTVTLPINGWLEPQSGVSATLKGRLNAGSGGVVVTVSGRILVASADTEMDAPYTMLLVADSNTESTAMEGQTSAEQCYTWQLKKWLAQQGRRTRLIDKSQASRTTSDFETLRGKGRLSLPFQPSVILYNLGTNDTVNATYQANLAAFIAHKQWRYPDSLLVVCGVFPRAASANEANNVLFRASASAAVVAAADPKISYCNLGGIFTASTGLAADGTTACYTTTDSTTSGTRIHLNVAAHGLAFVVLRDFFIAQGLVQKMPFSRGR